MRAKLFGVSVLALAAAMLLAAGATSQPPGGKDASGQTRVVVPTPGLEGLPTPDGDLTGFDLRQLMDELVRVRQEKAALERRERALLALIPKRIEAQRKELSELERRLKDLEAAPGRPPQGKKGPRPGG
jgi:hypothetical protein